MMHCRTVPGVDRHTNFSVLEPWDYWRPQTTFMPRTIEISDELRTRIDQHREEDESYEEFIEELVAIFETEGKFMQEGYSE